MFKTPSILSNSRMTESQANTPALFKKVKRNQQVFDYQSSYVERQRIRRQKRRLLLLLLLIVSALLTVIFSSKLWAQSVTQTALERADSLVYPPTFIFTGAENTQLSAQAIDTQVDIKVSGLIAHTTVKQVFVNNEDVPLNGRYQFPLPDNAAVNYLRIALGERVIDGKIMEKQQARKVFEQAKITGKKASLVEQQRPNLFTNDIANIPAGERIVITIKYVQQLSFRDGEFALNFPLAITPRYFPHDHQLTKGDEKLALSEPEIQAMLASKTSPKASISVLIDAGIPLQEVSSNSHKIVVQPLDTQQSNYLVGLDNSVRQRYKSFNLTWRPKPSDAPQVAMFEQALAGENFGVMMIMPPSQEINTKLARDVTFIIDTSGSMQGSSMAQAKASLVFALTTLAPQDSFNIIAFDSSADMLFQTTKLATATRLAAAKHFIASLTADGGTEMYKPLNQALLMPQSTEQDLSAIRQIIFITDGAVGNEQELLQLVNNNRHQQRLFTVGIGSAPNGYFMKKAAQFGRGSYTFIDNTADVAKKMRVLLTKISQPVATDLALNISHYQNSDIELYPETLPDLYHSEPVMVAYRTRQPLSTVELTGQFDQKPWSREISMVSNKYRQQQTGINTVWARAKVADLLDGLVLGNDKQKVRQQVLATALAHQILSPYTSFIAVERVEIKDEPTSLDDHASLQANNRPVKKQLLTMPNTALGWQLQTLIALLILVISLLAKRCLNSVQKKQLYSKKFAVNE